MISRSVIPMGTSIRPVLLIFPTSENILVPLLVGGADAAIPIRAAVDDEGTVARVSTLLMTVGQPHNPDLSGKGGRGAVPDFLLQWSG